MSFQVGLGASQEDWDVQGEVDFDFFDENLSSGVGETDSERFNYNTITGSPTNVQKPIITISFGNENIDTANKTVIETVIPPLILTNGKFQSEENNEQNRSLLPRNGDTLSKSVHNVKSDLKECSSNSTTASLLEPDSDASSDGGDSIERCQSSSVSDASVLSSSVNSRQSGRIRDFSSHKGHRDCTASGSKNKKVFSDYNTDASAALFNSFRCNCKYDKASVDALLKAVKRLELAQGASNARSQRSTPLPLPDRSKDKKNMSFSNEEVRLIDQENQRLLKRILVHQNRSKPKLLKKSSNLPSSAVNRQRQQRQIELDNMAFLKRLEAAKPSQNLSRSRLLRDYEKQHSRPASSQVSTRPSSSNCSSLLSWSQSSSHSVRKSTLKKVRLEENIGSESHLLHTVKSTKKCKM